MSSQSISFPIFNTDAQPLGKAVSTLNLTLLVPPNTTNERIIQLFAAASGFNANSLAVIRTHSFIYIKHPASPKSTIPSPEEIFIRTLAESDQDPEVFEEHFKAAFEKWSASKKGPEYVVRSYEENGLKSLINGEKKWDRLIESFIANSMVISGVRLFNCYAIREAFQGSREGQLLENTPSFTTLVDLCLGRRRINILNSAAKGDFKNLQTHEVAENYADLRKINGNHPYLNLFHISAGSLISFIQEVFEEQKTHQCPFRCQIVLDQGHSTALDLKFDKDNCSLVVLDSINEFGPTLTGIIPKLINDYKIKVYLIKEALPSLSGYSITLSKVPKNLDKRVGSSNGSGLPFMQPASGNEIRLLFCFQEEAWYLKTDSCESGNKIENSDLIQFLETHGDGKSYDQSELITLLYKTSLPLPRFFAKTMQTNYTSCESYALYFAVTAGKEADIHEKCAEVDQSNPLLQRFRSELGPNFSQVNFALWSHLPAKFSKWSQSQVLKKYTGKRQNRSIDQAMNEKVKEELKNIELKIETRKKRIQRLMNERLILETAVAHGPKSQDFDSEMGESN